MRILAYGIVADCVDEYLKIGKRTTLECLKIFASGVIQTFGQDYLRKLTQADIDRLLQVAEACDFSPTLGNIDCIHWEWKNCSLGWKREFAKGVYKVLTLILEAIAAYDLWIWDAFFRCLETLNDLNVLDCSLVLQELYKDRAPKCEYIINDHKYNSGYFLPDSIYQKWAAFKKTIHHPQGPNAKLCSEC